MQGLQILVLLGLLGYCFGAGGSVGGGGGGGSDIEVVETEGVKRLIPEKPLLLSCNQTHGDNVSWKRNGELIVDSGRIKVHKQNSSLYFTSAEKGDAANYTCMPSQQTISVVYLKLNKKLPSSTTVLENDKMSLNCQVEGIPTPTVHWLRDGVAVEEAINSTRLELQDNDSVKDGKLRIEPVLKSDKGNYVCVINQYSLVLNTTTEVKVKDIYAALWPFLGIVAEVIVLCIIIFIYEKRRIKQEDYDDSDTDQDANEQKSPTDDKEAEVRQRK
ncbi:unnamed protein product [Meganyctiphanes norvegica]|uniref:Ig-like domain-containing protein n=1 Tax=Meganyctiphanes norvegica TaxID=48144 RepID=A0AAV2QGJ6_MEGNR